ncbi:MAG: hypothetical protein E6Q93_00535, partial [Burkholderiaceae bacterium]
LEDWERAVSGQPAVGLEAFKVGKDIAVTPGKVVYRNRLIEDVVLHDPGRHDEDRLGPDFRRRGRVLDEFDQPVPVDDLAGRDGHVAPRHECVRPRRTAARDRALPVLDEVLRAAQQVPAALGGGLRQHVGVRRQEVRRREHVERLPRHELHEVLVPGGDAAHVGGRVVPPLLVQQEALVDQVERPALPAFGGEAPVVRQRLDAARAVPVLTGRAGGRIGREAQRLAHRLVRQQHALAGRCRQVDRPVHGGLRHCRRRHAAGEARGRRVHGAIGDVPQRRRGVRIALKRQSDQRMRRALRQGHRGGPCRRFGVDAPAGRACRRPRGVRGCRGRRCVRGGRGRRRTLAGVGPARCAANATRQGGDLGVAHSAHVLAWTRDAAPYTRPPHAGLPGLRACGLAGLRACGLAGPGV